MLTKKSVPSEPALSSGTGADKPRSVKSPPAGEKIILAPMLCQLDGRNSSPVVLKEVDHNKNKYVGLSRISLQEAELRLLNEQANYRTDSKRAREKLATARSNLAAVGHELEQLQTAKNLAAVLPFQKPVLELPGTEVRKAKAGRKLG
jgi:hypothetical protein